MSKFRFRLYKDIEIKASSQRSAEKKLAKAAGTDGSLAQMRADGTVVCLGEVDTVKITDEERKCAKNVFEMKENMIMMSGQYRGENCTFLTLKTPRPDLGDDALSLRPLAILLTEEKLFHCRDIEGETPEDHGHTYNA